MSDLIATDAQKLEQDVLVEMFEIDLREYGEGIHRFSPGPVEGEPVEFNGYQYKTVPIKAEGFKWDGQGTAPTPTLTVSVMTPGLSSLIRNGGDLLGSEVKRIRTYRRYLDDGLTPDPEARFPTEVYAIERKVRQNSVMAEFELAVSFDQEGKKIPGRQVIRDTCTHTYRHWDGDKFSYKSVTCPYAGENFFKANGQSTPLPEEDVCGKRLSDCEKRFPTGSLPFYGFPGAGRL